MFYSNGMSEQTAMLNF